MPIHRSFLVVLAALALAFAGCTTQESDPPTETGDAPEDAEVHDTATMAPGTTANLPLALTNASWGVDEARVTVSDAAGLDVTPGQLFQQSEGTLSAWIGFTVPENATAGAHDVVLTVGPEGAEDARRVAFTITVEDAEPRLQEGDVAVVNVTAHTEDGAIAFTTVAGLAETVFPTAPGYQPPQDHAAVPIPLNAQSRLPQEMKDGLSAMAVGHSRAVAVPDAFGPATIEQDEPRQENVQRSKEERRTLEAPRDFVEQQGFVGPDAQEGDPVELPGTPMPYVIEFLNETHVRIALDVAEGDTFTLHAAWPNASEVVAVDNETVTIRTDPPVEIGERFTWREGWTDATEIVEMDDEVIILRHSPEEGATYTDTTAQGQPAEFTVVSVEEDGIVVSMENPHPLGGKTLTFDMTVVERRDPPAAPGGAP